MWNNSASSCEYEQWTSWVELETSKKSRNNNGTNGAYKKKNTEYNNSAVNASKHVRHGNGFELAVQPKLIQNHRIDETKPSISWMLSCRLVSLHCNANMKWSEKRNTEWRIVEWKTEEERERETDSPIVYAAWTRRVRNTFQCAMKNFPFGKSLKCDKGKLPAIFIITTYDGWHSLRT